MLLDDLDLKILHVLMRHGKIDKKELYEKLKTFTTIQQFYRTIRSLRKYGLIEEINGKLKLTEKGRHLKHWEKWETIIDEILTLLYSGPKYLRQILDLKHKLGVNEYIIHKVLGYLIKKGLIRTWVEFVEKKKHRKNKKYVKYRYFALTEKGKQEAKKSLEDDMEIEIMEGPNITDKELKKKILETMAKSGRPLLPGRIANLLQKQEINISRGYVLDLLIELRKQRLVKRTRSGWVTSF